MRRGEVWWANFPPPFGRRPALLLSRDEAYAFLTNVVVAPITTRLRETPSAVRLDPRTDRDPRSSVVTLDNVQAVPLTWLESFIVRLNSERMREVEQAIHFALGLSY